MTIKSTRMNGVVVDDNMLSRAIEELASAHGRSVRDEHALILSRVDDRNSAESWALAIGLVATEQEASSNVRVRPAKTTTGTEDDTVGLSAEAVVAEVDRLVAQDNAGRRPVLAHKPSTSVPCRTVAMSRQHERLYDDEQLALTSVVGDDRSALNEYLIKLSRGEQGKRALGDLAALAGGQTRTDVLDVGTPSESDLDDEVTLPSQSTEFGRNTLSDQAEQQLAALPPAYQTALEAYLDAAASEQDPTEAESLLESAVALAERFGLSTLRNELSARAEALRQGYASHLNDPEETETQSASGVEAEVQRYSEMVPVQNGSKSTPPKSVAVRNAEEQRARPGHTGTLNPIRA